MPSHANQASVTISASTTTASAAIPAEYAKKYIRVCNPTSAVCFVKTGEGSATATTGGQFVGPTSTAILEKPEHHNYVAVILSTGTGNIYVAPTGNPD